jgi:hypothetical protein
MNEHVSQAGQISPGDRNVSLLLLADRADFN